MKVFPSPPTEEVIVIIFFFLSAAKYCMLVLNDLNDSAIIDFDDLGTTRLVALSLCPISPNIGIFVAFLRSTLFEIVSLKKFFR